MGWAWSALSPAHLPTKYDGASLALDEANGQVVLFGGVDPATGNGVAQTWLWDGSDWTQQTPAHSPSARFDAAMAYLAGTGVVLFGGTLDGFTLRGDTWKWTGSDWTQLFPASSPSARWQHNMAYWPSGGKIVLNGGSDGGGLNLQTWTYNGTTWANVTPGTVSPPDAHTLFGICRDAAGNARLYGAANGILTNHLYLWNGTTWVDESFVSAGQNNTTGMAWHANAGLAVFIQQNSSDTFIERGLTFDQTLTSVPWSNGRPANSLIVQNVNGNVIYLHGNASGTTRALYELTFTTAPARVALI